MSKDQKILVVGLPRTGTTTVCAAFLDWGYQVAHTAFTQQAFQLADVIADTPVFTDYQALHQVFPNTIFICLTRDFSGWSRSTRILLAKIRARNRVNPNALHPLVIRSFSRVYPNFLELEEYCDAYLKRCYEQHQATLFKYLNVSNAEFLQIDVAQGNAFELLATRFAKRKMSLLTKTTTSNSAFVVINEHGRINGWQNLKHVNKVDCNAFGPERRRYFDF